MAKVKITREIDGKQTELEVGEDEVLESDTLVTETQPSKNEDKPKTFTQEEVNSLLARERKSWQGKFGTLQGQFDALQKQVQDTEAAAEEKAKAQVTELRKGLPENVARLLDRLSYSEQLEWLQDPANKQTERKQIPSLPRVRDGKGEPDSLGIARIKF